jgi:hypothetical protein
MSRQRRGNSNKINGRRKKGGGTMNVHAAANVFLIILPFFSFIAFWKVGERKELIRNKFLFSYIFVLYLGTVQILHRF